MKLKVLFQVPHVNTIYAGRTIFSGYKNAFIDLGHEFRSLTSADNHTKVFEEFSPNVLITSLSAYNFRYLDLDLVYKHKKRGLKVFSFIPFWKSPLSKLRINEQPGLSEDKDMLRILKSGKFGDVYFNVCEKEDERMAGFDQGTGYKHHTIPLAADKSMHFPEFDDRFACDISFLGTNLPEKRKFIKENVITLAKKYDLKLFGQDWTLTEQALSYADKFGRYFNVPLLNSFRKPNLKLEDERRIYNSSTVSLNIHEEYQKKYGGDCNERTFKIPASGGFEISDRVACIAKYLKEGEEIVIADGKKDLHDKIDFYIKHPAKRKKIIEAGRGKVLESHTYHNRVGELLKIYQTL